MHGAYARRPHEERRWRRDWADDIRDAERERYDLETLRRMIHRFWGDDVRAYMKNYFDSTPLW
jgi:hypothetical protein